MTSSDGRQPFVVARAAAAGSPRSADQLEEQSKVLHERIAQLEQEAGAQHRHFDQLVLDLLGVADTLHALDEHFAGLELQGEKVPRKSVQIALRKFLGVLKKYGVAPMQCAGQQLDLDRHEVVEVKAVREVAHDIVLEETLRGYLYVDRVLRHAKVVVNQNEGGVAAAPRPRARKPSHSKRNSKRKEESSES